MIKKQEGRDLAVRRRLRYPGQFTPEFPPPMFLTSRPDLGDVSQGQVLTIKNYYALLYGKVTPVQMEGMRLLLTPNPQQQFNQTEDRKVREASLGVACFDCHTNGHTNGTFHENPDTRPQEDRLRIETVSLRGEFNQLIHGSKRSLRSIEDFTEFEQRRHVATLSRPPRSVFLPNRSDGVDDGSDAEHAGLPATPKLDVSAS
jgi:cytochrome c peroxidase